VTDGRTITIELRSLNPFLKCNLCDGYLRDAHTVTECLHSFCKTCLFDYIEKQQEDYDDDCNCPTCGISLGPDPKRRFINCDRTLQNIVDKFVPEYAAADEKLKEELGIPLVTHTPVASTKPKKNKSGAYSSKKRNEPTLNSSTKPAEDEKEEDTLVIFELKPELPFSYSLRTKRKSIEGNNSRLLPALEKPFIRTSSKATVRHIKKYIAIKTGISADEVDISCRGDILGSDHSLDFIKKTRWLDNTKTLLLGYARHESLL